MIPHFFTLVMLYAIIEPLWKSSQITLVSQTSFRIFNGTSLLAFFGEMKNEE